jgi:hypothetical protein
MPSGNLWLPIRLALAIVELRRYFKAFSKYWCGPAVSSDLFCDLATLIQESFANARRLRIRCLFNGTIARDPFNGWHPLFIVRSRLTETDQ